MFEINEDKFYYFLTLQKGRYNTGFVSWLTEDLVNGLTEYFATCDLHDVCFHLEMSIGENRFVFETNQPLYLLDCEKTNAFEFAGDDNKLGIFPSGNIPVEFEG